MKNNKNMQIKSNKIWVKNIDCLNFLNEIPDNSVDLILTDPPFGLRESLFDKKHYARKDKKIVNGYIEAPLDISYENWCFQWISKFNRILKPNGSVMIFSGWTREADIQYAIKKTDKFRMINHLIWHYNFGVSTSKKFVSSHYHILYFCKKNAHPFFNQYAYHNEDHNKEGNGSEVYKDIQDVIKINKEYKPGKAKNCNTLPLKLIEKLIKHTTKRHDIVLDIFSGGFTTQFASLKLHRKAWGCEINRKSCEIFFPLLKEFKNIYKNDYDIDGYTKSQKLSNQGKPLSIKDREEIKFYFNKISGTKKEKIKKTARHFMRGSFAINRIVNS